MMRKLKLSKEHLAELKASGLSYETIRAAKLYTEKDNQTICKILNCNSPELINGSDALIIPFGYDGFVRLKLSNPRYRKNNTDKFIKYESPWGSKQHPYFPPNTFDEIVRHETDKEIFIVEGEKKALKLWQEFKEHEIDAYIIGLTGVYGWKEKQHERLNEWLMQIHWTNRIVYLCFDNDVHWNRNVSEARKRFAKILKNNGAIPKAIDIPITDPSQKYGVDDYIVKYGIEAYFSCLANASEIKTDNVINLEIVTASEIESKPVEWLWYLYIPKGEITLLDGNPGLGKSQMVADIAARVTRGYALPPVESGVPLTEPANVMMLCAEDSLDKTVKPRLKACNANGKKVFFLRPKGRPVTFPDDLERFEQECLELEIELVIIDPIMSYIGKGIDTHSDQSARQVLNRLKEFAENTNIAIVMLRHLNKRQGDAAIFRGGGSIAFTAASRCNMIVGKHPNDDEVNVLAVIKTNLGVKPMSLSYTIESVETKHGSIGRIKWIDEIDLDADDISDIDRSQKKIKKLDKAIDAIEKLLKLNGPMLSTQLQDAVIKESGIAPSTYQHARKKSNICRGRNPTQRANGKWWSKLPGQSFPWEPRKKTPAS